MISLIGSARIVKRAATAALFVFSILGLSFAECTAQEKPYNERMTAAAWEAFNAEHYEEAIATASKCIDEFRGAARRMQEKLEKQKADVPTGKVSEEKKQEIFANGLLNDVGACYFIKGRAAEKLGRKDEARRAYEDASKLTFSRVWDTHGWFWSPAESASDRLEGMR